MKISKVYIFYFVSSFIVVLLVAVYFSLDSLENALQRKKQELFSIKIQTAKEREKAVELEKFINQNGLHPLDKETARNVILESLNMFLALYDARITKPLSEKNDSYTAGISFDYYPESSEELFRFLNSLKQQKYPILIIDRFKLENRKEGSVVSFEITLEQPFIK